MQQRIGPGAADLQPALITTQTVDLPGADDDDHSKITCKMRGLLWHHMEELTRPKKTAIQESNPHGRPH